EFDDFFVALDALADFLAPGADRHLADRLADRGDFQFDRHGGLSMKPARSACRRWSPGFSLRSRRVKGGIATVCVLPTSSTTVISPRLKPELQRHAERAGYLNASSSNRSCSSL